MTNDRFYIFGSWWESNNYDTGPCWNPLKHTPVGVIHCPWGSQRVVLLSPKVWNGRRWGQELVIGMACFTTCYGPQKMRLVSFFHVEVISRTTHAQNTVVMLVHRENTMNHVGHHHTTAAIVPHPQLRDVETLANMLWNKAMSFKRGMLYVTILKSYIR